MSESIEVEATASHTIFIIVGALVVLWLLGTITFKGVRQ